jgi:hypothetical protein
VRILHITTAHRADDARIYHKECVSLWRAGYDVQLVAPGPSRPADAHGPAVIGLGGPRSRLVRMAGAPLRVLRVLRRERPDLIHIHDPELLLVVPIARLLGCRIVYDAHEDAPRHITSKPYIPAAIRPSVARCFEFFENLVTRLCGLVVAATPDIADRFAALGRTTVCIRNFALTREFSVGAAERGQSLVYIGGLRADRGAYDMVALADRLELPLHLAGPGWPAGLVDELSRLPGWRHCTYHGVLDRTGVAELLKSCSVGLALLHPRPNYVTSLPVKMFEYLAAGLPVLASDFSYWRELSAGSAAIAFAPASDVEGQERDARLLLDRIAADPAGMREAACGLFRDRFSWETEESALLAAYAKLVGRPVSRPPAQEQPSA